MDRGADPLLGRALNGRYSLVRRVARGGMATVYEAQDLRLQRSCAVKVMHTDLTHTDPGHDHDFAARFVREAHSAARLSHPNVVSVTDLGEDDGLLYLVMEYLPGRTLRDVIAEAAPLPARRALALLEPVLAALAEAHRCGLVHRDVKPENVLIGDDGRVKVADFGLARAFDTAAEASAGAHSTATSSATSSATSTATSTVTGGILIGTVSYLAPELIVNQRADPRADVYAAGVVLYELLTGHKPHQGDGPIQVAFKHVNEDVPAPSAALAAHARGRLPAYVDALVQRATARDRDRRPTDAKVLLHQVRRVRAALEAGVEDDPELTADLLPTRPITVAESIDYVEETTTIVPQLVPAAAVTTTGLDSRPPPRAPGPPPGGMPPASHDPRITDRPLHLSAAGSSAAVPRSQRRRRRGPLVLALLVATVAAVAYGAWWLGIGRYTSTPAIEQLGVGAAQARLADAELELTVVSRVFSETVPAGAIIRSDPAAGSRIPDGGTVDVVVSKGQERYAVPVLRGRRLGEAESRLTTASLTLGDVTATWSETVPRGAVITAAPTGGTELRRGTPVDVTLSRGPEPIDIPDTTGRPADRAQQRLTELGFEPDVVTEHSLTVEEGRVIAQSPDDGTGHRGDSIALTVSLGPVLVEVPDVAAMNVEEATAALTEAGLEIEVDQTKLYIGLDAVVEQDPAAGTSVPEGSTVTVSVV